MKSLSKHLKHYTPLVGILLASFFGFWMFSFDRLFQVAIIIASAAGYVTWGVVNHLVHKDLTMEVVMEYLAVAAVGVIAALSLVFRA